jgi:hypothetical protein
MKVKLGIPTTKQMIKTARDRVIKTQPNILEPDYINANFSTVIETLFQTTYDVYLECENTAIEKITQDTLDRIDKATLTKAEVATILRSIVQQAIDTEKSLKQSRYARAGSVFEIIVQDLLNRVGIHSEHVTREDKKSGLRPIDLVVPDRKTAIERPDKAHFLSLKTSLKDRWKLVVEDQQQGQRTHLLTLLQREKLTNAVAAKIIGRGIFLYIPDAVKAESFPNEPRVRNLSTLPTEIRD